MINIHSVGHKVNASGMELTRNIKQRMLLFWYLDRFSSRSAMLGRVLAIRDVSVCPSVRLSHARNASNLMIMVSWGFYRRIAQSLYSFSRPTFIPSTEGNPLLRELHTRLWWVKTAKNRRFRHSRPTSIIKRLTLR